MHPTALLALSFLGGLWLSPAAAQAVNSTSYVNATTLMTTTQSRWTLIWRDEFGGSKLNRNKWSFELGDACQYLSQDQPLCGWGNSEFQYYTARPENVRVENGSLVIEARQERQSGERITALNNRFTSGRIKTQGRFAVMPGEKWKVIKVAARIRAPPGLGIWPAFWMLPTYDDTQLGSGRYGRWAASGEIDIMELVNDMTKVHGTIHFGDSWDKNVFLTATVDAASLGLTPFGGNWHVYSIEWEPTQIRWYVDDVLYATQNSRSTTPGGWFTAGAGGGPNAPFDRPFHIILNMAVGGGFVNNDMAPYRVVSPEEVAATLAQPKQLLVDWVRVSGKN